MSNRRARTVFRRRDRTEGQIRLQGVVVRSLTDQLEMIRAIESLGVRPVIDSSFHLQELPAAFRHQEAGRHIGKIVVEM
ncbi:zinc-binding dehydrogenase [Cupriavidus necator]|uniref:zinc-binding dehydrogenase n=1 Tax=Cupriavidus necator TaxID=106590 RepID=UPI001E48FED0|nr:zinc-binding dehydrogenase [Cupriavidus necator]